MDNFILKNKLIEEIDLVPNDKATELYNLIHNFRISVNHSQNNIKEIMDFAGCWNDISEDEWLDFYNDITKRRHNIVYRD